MTITRSTALTLTLVTLTACGGSGDGGIVPIPVPEPKTADIAAASLSTSNIFSDFNAVGDSRTVVRTRPSDANVSTIALSADSSALESGSAFSAFASSPSGARFRLFEAKAGGATARTIGFVNDNVNLSYLPQSDATTVGGSVPLAGTASYDGEYVGFFSRNGSASNPRLTQSYVQGDVSMTADFSAESVNGEVTDRIRYATTDDRQLGTMADITLGTLDINGGRSSNAGGDTQGGRLVQANSRTFNNRQLGGNWTVALSGNAAADAVGTVTVDHNYLNSTGLIQNDYVETGVFALTKN
jgi:hypothetical protein